MQNKTFRLFISSPFSDFTKEREVLHKRVFPKIEEYCNQHHLSFQPVDLRWGVNEEAQLDQKTLEVCLEEVRACKHFPHPHFLIMAGDRYGYVPCPYMIEKSEFNSLQKSIVKKEDLEILNFWYKLDKNQIYLCPDDTESTAYILQPRTDKYTDYTNWEKQESKLRAILQDAAKHIFKSEKDKESKEYQKYFLSATEQEAIEGIYQFKNKTDSQKQYDEEKDKKYIFGYTRSIEKIDNSEDNQIYLDRLNKKPVPELKAKADGFKIDLQKLLKDNVFQPSFPSVKEYNANELTEFEEYITEKLKSAINEQLPKTENLTKEEEQKLKLEQEISEQTKFLKDKVKGFQGREKTLTKIENYLKEDTIEPLIIHGPSGMGKSSLMGKAIKSTKTDSTIFRFVGATANSTTIRNLLISIVDELQDKEIIEQIEEYETDEYKFDTQIKDILLSIDKETTIFIDALDQLQYKNYLNWLPNELKSNLKIILTVLNDEKYEEDTHYYNLLTERYDNTKFIDITKDSLEEKKEKLIKDLLEIEHRKLNQAQTAYLLEQWAKTGYSPLYLKISIEEVKHWKHCEEEDGTPILCKKQKLESSVEGIIEEYFENLKKLYHHEELLIKKVFGYIHASKDGLSEQELLHILSEDLEDDEAFRKVIINEWHTPIKVINPRRDGKEEHTLPISIWSRLHTQIKPFLIERNIDGQPLMKFFHRQFTSVVEKYIEDDKPKLHTKLADYFSTLQDTTKTWDKRYHNPHMLDEVPYQLYTIGDSKRLKEVLFDLEFAGSVYDHHKQDAFLEILGNASILEGITQEEIYPWIDFFNNNAFLISTNNQKNWLPHQTLYQLAYEDEYISENAKGIKNKVDFHYATSQSDIYASDMIQSEERLQIIKSYTSLDDCYENVEVDFGVDLKMRWPEYRYNSKRKEIDEYASNLGANTRREGNLCFFEVKTDEKSLRETSITDLDLKYISSFQCEMIKTDRGNHNKYFFEFSQPEYYYFPKIETNYNDLLTIIPYKIKFELDFFYFAIHVDYNQKIESTWFNLHYDPDFLSNGDDYIAIFKMTYTGDVLEYLEIPLLINRLDGIDDIRLINDSYYMIAGSYDKPSLYKANEDGFELMTTIENVYIMYFLSHCGSKIYLSTDDYRLYVYDTLTKRIDKYQIGLSMIDDCLVIDDDLLLIEDDVRQFCVFDINKTRKQIKMPHENRIENLLITDDYLLTYSKDGRLVHWNRQGIVVGVLELSKKALNADLLPINEQYILVILHNLFIIVDVLTMKEIRSVEYSEYVVVSSEGIGYYDIDGGFDFIDGYENHNSLNEKYYFTESNGYDNDCTTYSFLDYKIKSEPFNLNLFDDLYYVPRSYLATLYRTHNNLFIVCELNLLKVLDIHFLGAQSEPKVQENDYFQKIIEWLAEHEDDIPF